MRRTISVEVGKGSTNHNSRKFNAKNTDPERMHLNTDFCNERIKTVYHELFDDALVRYNAKQKAELNGDQKQIDDVGVFIAKVRNVTDFIELTPELVHKFIEKIIVHEPYRENGKRFQQVDIHYLGVGVITVPTPEELEMDFQRLLSERNKTHKETA